MHRAPLDLSVPDPTQIFSSRVISTKNVYSLSCVYSVRWSCSLHACLWMDTTAFFFCSHVNAFTSYICWCLSCAHRLVYICSFAVNMYASASPHVLACVFFAIPFKCAVYASAGDACSVFVDVNCHGVMLSWRTQLCVHTNPCARAKNGKRDSLNSLYKRKLLKRQNGFPLSLNPIY